MTLRDEIAAVLDTTVDLKDYDRDTAIDRLVALVEAREAVIVKAWGDSDKSHKAQVAALREAAKRAANELGVPQPGYPASVSNAANILRAALAATAAGETP